MTANELREAAAAKFKEAADLVDGKDIGDIDAEVRTRFDGLFKEATELDRQYQSAAGNEGVALTLKERLEFYHGKATGKPLDWTQLSEKDRVAGLPHYAGGGVIVPDIKSPGQFFVGSDEYKELKESGHLNSDTSSFKSRPVEVKAPTDLITGTSPGPASALITPQFLPGILGLPQQPLTIRDLFSQATTDSDTLSYARQATFESAAAAVAEATAVSGASGTKPQSSISWVRQTSPIETIATWMASTRRALADAGQIRALIDNQLNLMLQLEEEDQLMNGNGTSPNLRGLNNVSGIQTLDLSLAAGEPNLDGLRTAKRLVRTGAARAAADGVVMNPVDSEEFDLLKDLEGRYRAGDPFGNGVEAPPIWRMRRVESEAVPAGTVWVGAFRQGATVFQRQGIVILTSDSHADFFVRNLIAVLAEERLGFAVFFPAAFVKVTLKAWP